jgi:small subunit ribosomal protein S16
MAVKIRLQRHGRKKAPFYHIVIADSRSPRDGRFIEKIGTYNPMTAPATIQLDLDLAFDWLNKGAQPTDTVNAILRSRGVLYRKHLAKGVKKGAMTQEKADKMHTDFMESRMKRISDSFDRNAQKKADFRAQVVGTPKAKKVVEAPAAEVTETASEAAAAE